MKAAGFHAAQRHFARRWPARQFIGTGLRAWGWPGALGLVCLLAAAGLAGLATPALESKAGLAQAAADAADLRTARLGARAVDAAGAISPPARFRAAFPSAEHRQERLAALLEHAAAQGLEARRSEFQLNTEPGSGLLRYQMAMPVKGTYAGLIGFINAAQQSDPALSLDSMRLRRASAATSSIDADFVWSFYMQADPSVGSPADIDPGNPGRPGSVVRPGRLR